MLIATLPPIYCEDLLEQIVSCPEVDAVRYNTGMVSPYPINETLRRLKDLAELNSKHLWIDLKGRQLRIVNWAVPDYGQIVLNHEVEVDGSARVCFRGNEFSELKFAHGKTIFVDPPPKSAVGQGQAINILGENVSILGYSTQEDLEWLSAGSAMGIADYCLSFVECWQDIREVEAILPETKQRLWLKIETPKGFDFVSGFSRDEEKPYGIIAARDDLFVTIGEDKSKILGMLAKLSTICYPNTVLASRLFSGLETVGYVTLADFTDIELMRWFGYKHFMLSDGICRKHFAEAIEAWRETQRTTRFKEGGLI